MREGVEGVVDGKCQCGRGALQARARHGVGS